MATWWYHCRNSWWLCPSPSHCKTDPSSHQLTDQASSPYPDSGRLKGSYLYYIFLTSAHLYCFLKFADEARCLLVLVMNVINVSQTISPPSSAPWHCPANHPTTTASSLHWLVLKHNSFTWSQGATANCLQQLWQYATETIGRLRGGREGREGRGHSKVNIFIK